MGAEVISIAERRAEREVKAAWGEIFMHMRIAAVVCDFNPELARRVEGRSNHVHEQATGFARLTVDASLPPAERHEAIARHVAAIACERAEQRKAVV